MPFLFDTNIFIRSKNELPADVWPSFWQAIALLIREEKIYSSEKVKKEIEQGNDELTVWMKANATPSFYCPIDGDVLSKYSATQNWASQQNFTALALKDYADTDKADAFLVATAAAKRLTLVTYETSDPLCRKRVKIPDACLPLGVKFCDLNTALRALDVII